MFLINNHYPLVCPTFLILRWESTPNVVEPCYNMLVLYFVMISILFNLPNIIELHPPSNSPFMEMYVKKQQTLNSFIVFKHTQFGPNVNVHIKRTTSPKKLSHFHSCLFEWIQGIPLIGMIVYFLQYNFYKCAWNCKHHSQFLNCYYYFSSYNLDLLLFNNERWTQ